MGFVCLQWVKCTPFSVRYGLVWSQMGDLDVNILYIVLHARVWNVYLYLLYFVCVLCIVLYAFPTPAHILNDLLCRCVFTQSKCVCVCVSPGRVSRRLILVDTSSSSHLRTRPPPGPPPGPPRGPPHQESLYDLQPHWNTPTIKNLSLFCRSSPTVGINWKFTCKCILFTQMQSRFLLLIP